MEKMRNKTTGLNNNTKKYEGNDGNRMNTKKEGINEVSDSAAQNMHSIIEMFSQLHITPECDPTNPFRNNSGSNDKLKDSNEKSDVQVKQIIIGLNGVKVENGNQLQYGFVKMKYKKAEISTTLHDLAKTNEDLIPSQSVAIFNAAPQTSTTNSGSVFIFGGQNTATPSSTSLIINVAAKRTKSISENTASEIRLYNNGAEASTTPTLVPIVTNPASLRNKFGLTKKISVARRKLRDKPPIVSSEFKTISLTPCTGPQVIGDLKTSVSIFDQKSTSKFKDMASAGRLNLKKTVKINSTPNIVKKTNYIRHYNTTVPTFSTLKESIGCFIGSLETSNNVYMFGGRLILSSVFKEMSEPTVFNDARSEKIQIDMYNYKDYSSALAMFGEAILLQPDNGTFYAIRCFYYMKLGMYNEAIKDAQQAITFDPAFTFGYIYLAICHMASGNLIGAKDIMDQVVVGDDRQVEDTIQKMRGLIHLYKETKQDIYCQQYLSAVKKANSYLKLCPSNKVRGLKARCLAMLGKIELASEIAEKCLRIDNTEIEAIYAKGLCHYYRVQLEEALELFQKVLDIEPEYNHAPYQIKIATLLKNTLKEGDVLFNSGHWLEAEDKYEEARKIDEHHNYLAVIVHCKLGAINAGVGSMYTAVMKYSKALKLDSNYVEALHGRAKCFIKNENYESALEDYESMARIVESEEMKQSVRNSIIDLKKKLINEHMRKAETIIQFQIPEVEKALNLAEKCLLLNDSAIRALYVKGLCLYFKDQYQEAIDQFEQILLLEPSHSMARIKANNVQSLKSAIEKGSDAMNICRWQDALDHYTDAFSYIETNNSSLKIKLFFKKASIFLKLNKIHRAIEEYRSILFYDNDSVEALRGRAKCYCDIGEYEKAVKDYEHLYSIEESNEAKTLLHKTKKALNSAKKVEAGNKFYKQNRFKNSLEMYKEAIRLCPENAELYNIYCNTFACYMKLSMRKEALDDAKKAVALYVKSGEDMEGIAKCYIALGDLYGAERAIMKAIAAGKDCKEDQHVLSTLQRLHGQAEKYIKERIYSSAISCVDQCIEHSPFSSKAKLLKAECLAMLGKIDQGLEIVDECLRSDRFDAEAIFVKGLCIYYNEKFEQALKYFKEVQRLSPDHGRVSAIYKKAKLLEQKKEKGNEAFRTRRWQEALHLYKEALTIDEEHIKMNAKLHFNMATVYAKLNRTQAAAEACAEALELDGNYVKALTLRAKCYTDLGEYDCAVTDYEQLHRINPSVEIKKLLDEAKRSLKEQARRKDYYKILGVNRSASKEDITKAYKRLALAHHPDRHSDRPRFERERQTRRFQQISEAYNVLSNENQRRNYDAEGNFY